MTNTELTVENFILKIVEEFPELKKEDLDPNKSFKDHVEWDSINALVLIAMVNVEYDVTVNAEELAHAETINDVFLVIKKKVEELEAEGPKPEEPKSFNDPVTNNNNDINEANDTDDE